MKQLVCRSIPNLYLLLHGRCKRPALWRISQVCAAPICFFENMKHLPGGHIPDSHRVSKPPVGSKLPAIRREGQSTNFSSLPFADVDQFPCSCFPDPKNPGNKTHCQQLAVRGISHCTNGMSGRQATDRSEWQRLLWKGKRIWLGPDFLLVGRQIRARIIVGEPNRHECPQRQKNNCASDA